MIYFHDALMYNSLCAVQLHTHSEFTDEGVLGNPDVEFYFLGLVHTIGHAACDDSGCITTGHCGVDVKAVDVPVVLSKYRRRHISQ